MRQENWKEKAERRLQNCIILFMGFLMMTAMWYDLTRKIEKGERIEMNGKFYRAVEVK